MVDQVKENHAPDAAFFKDAVYNVLGVCANELYDELDFDQLLEKFLVKDVMNSGASSAATLLKRRVAWLIGKFVQVKLSPEKRPLAYEILAHLASQPEISLTRLTAAGALHSCIDDWDFEPAAFAPFLASTLDSLVSLLQDVYTIECRLRILRCLSVVIERMEEHIKPFADNLMQLLPQLWQSSEGECLYQSSIISMLNRLVTSVRADSSRYYEFLCPLLAHSVDVNSPSHIYLAEDALELWHNMLQYAHSLTQPLADLFPLAVPLLRNNTENLRVLLWIIESYVIMDGAILLASAVGIQLFETLRGSLEQGLHPRAIAMIVRLLDLALRQVPVASISPALEASGLIWLMFTSLIEDKEPALALAQYMSFFARLAVQGTETMVQFMDHASSSSQPVAAKALIDNISSPSQRKLNALALAAILGSGYHPALAISNEICSVLLNVITEVKEENNGEQLLKNDIIHTINIIDFTRSRLM
ncbi:hypothetical protein EV182_003943, partial [Spiromyces aspiralis]